jgi:hypothetical protein
MSMPFSLVYRFVKTAFGQWLALIFCLVGLAAASAPAFAQDRVALLIGNNEYSDKNAKLANAVNDSTDLGNLLTQLGFKVIVRNDVSIEQMKDAVREFSASLDKAQVAVFFYAGHAMQFQGNNYLLPTNASLKSERDVLLDGFDVANILYLMGTGKTKNFVILDACRDNPFRDRFRAASGLAQMQAPADTLIAYSTAPGSVAYDGNGRNGIYTKNLLKLIGQAGQDSIRMFSQVGEAVQRETLTQKPPQVPWLLSSLRGQFSFGSNGAAAPTATAPNSNNWAPSADTQINAERVFWESLDKTNPDELALYMDRFPRGLYADLAKSRIATAKSAGARPSVALTKPEDRPVAKSPSQAETEGKEPSGNGLASANIANGQKTAEARSDEKLPTLALNQGRGIQPNSGTFLKQIKYNDGSTYFGETLNGAAHGQGEYSGLNGLSYVGQFDRGLRVGQGKLTLPNGDQYEGEFVNDLRQGKGAYRYKSGDVYVGEFLKDQAHGQGVWTFATGKKYVGTLAAGAIHGRGELSFPDRSRFVGDFKGGEPDGQGVFHFATGDTYEGTFLAGVFEGQGALSFPGGSKYVGGFKAGKAHGKGVFLYPDGAKFEGIFEMGTEHAKGELISASGTREKAEIVAGQTKRL